MARVSEDVKQLFEHYPYPSKKHADKRKLEKFLRWVSPAFGEKSLNFLHGKTVLDVGCGTGEFATALVLNGAEVLGIDFSRASIKQARAFAKKMEAKGIEFGCIDLFEFAPKERFDIVFSFGVLHHTESAEKAFRKTVSFCKPKGFVCIGLYNKFGRIRHRLKRMLLKLLAGSNVEKRMAIAKRLFVKHSRKDDEAWLADKFGQLHESYHSVGQVQKWFKKNGLVFAGSRPKIKGSVLLQQLKWLLEKKGAFFVMVGKKQSTCSCFRKPFGKRF